MEGEPTRPSQRCPSCVENSIILICLLKARMEPWNSIVYPGPSSFISSQVFLVIALNPFMVSVTYLPLFHKTLMISVNPRFTHFLQRNIFSSSSLWAPLDMRVAITIPYPSLKKGINLGMSPAFSFPSGLKKIIASPADLRKASRNASPLPDTD